MPKADNIRGGVTKTLRKTAARYLARVRAGELIMRDAAGRLQWACGKPVGRKTVQHMIETGQLHQLDTDIFGDFDRGQSIGLDRQAGG